MEPDDPENRSQGILGVFVFQLTKLAFWAAVVYFFCMSS